MEEEYRMQKTQSDIQQVLSATSTNGFPHSPGFDIGTAVIHDGTVQISSQASRRVLPYNRCQSQMRDEPLAASAVPTIIISTPSANGVVQEDGVRNLERPVQAAGERGIKM